MKTTGPYTGKAWNTGALGLPDLFHVYHPGEMPVGGFASLQHIAQTNMERDTQYLVQTLQAIAMLANNAYESIQMNARHQPGVQSSFFPNAYMIGQGMIAGLALNELEGMSYRRLQPQQVQLLIQRKVIVPDPNNPQMFAIDVNTLRNEMTVALTVMRAHTKKIWGAGGMDRAMQAATGMGNLQPSHSVNPFGSAGH